MGQTLIEQMGFRSQLILKLGPTEAKDESSKDSQFQGEVSLIAHTISDRTVLEVEHLGIYSPGIWTDSGFTGKLSIQGVTGAGTMAKKRKGWDCTADVRVQVLYRAIEKKKGFRETEPGRYRPDFALYRGQIHIVVKEYEEEGGVNEGEVESGSLDLHHESGGLDWVKSIHLPLQGSSMWVVKAPEGVLPCAAGFQAVRRQLKLMPVFVTNTPQIKKKTLDLWATQLANATQIWGRCCIDLLAQKEVIHVDPNLVRSEDPTSIQRAFQDKAPDVIEVFVVDSDLPNGGGTTFSAGSSLARVVITERSTKNPNLLAHELGHVLGGLHPDSPPNPPSWLADPDTVLEPSGSPDRPNPARNTLRNCRRADNPALVTTRVAGCIDAL